MAGHACKRRAVVAEGAVLAVGPVGPTAAGLVCGHRLTGMCHDPSGKLEP